MRQTHTKLTRSKSMATTRRDFLWQAGSGFGGLALASLLGRDGLFDHAARAAEVHDAAPPARAKRVVQLFMSGAASQCDTFDYKPELIKRNGEPSNPGG